MQDALDVVEEGLARDSSSKPLRKLRDKLVESVRSGGAVAVTTVRAAGSAAGGEKAGVGMVEEKVATTGPRGTQANPAFSGSVIERAVPAVIAASGSRATPAVPPLPRRQDHQQQQKQVQRPMSAFMRRRMGLQ